MKTPSEPESQYEDEHLRLKFLSGESGLILLYHGVWQTPPPTLVEGLHNVDPEQLGRQLEMLQRYFKIVTVDEFAKSADPRGLAAISFDDGYKCILQQGLPVFRALNIPFSIYLNGSTSTDGLFWRDKVRLIQTRGLVEEFEVFMQGIEAIGRFYRYTKHPTNNSMHVVQQIDRFLESKHIATDTGTLLNYCMNFETDVVADPLISYGNHSHNHYVMSSLSAEQQYEEIERTRLLLKSKPELIESENFSIPFGEERDFNEATIDAARQCGYSGVLLSRGRVHKRSQTCFDMLAFERLMPRVSDTDSGLLAALS